MECVLRDGSVSSFRILDVFHVSRLGYPFISWSELKTKLCTEFGEGEYIAINKETKVIFEAVFDGNLCKIPEISHLAHNVYNFCHQALGLLAP